MHCHYCETNIETEIDGMRLGESDLFFCLPCHNKFKNNNTNDEKS